MTLPLSSAPPAPGGAGTDTGGSAAAPSAETGQFLAALLAALLAPALTGAGPNAPAADAETTTAASPATTIGGVAGATAPAGTAAAATSTAGAAMTPLPDAAASAPEATRATAPSPASAAASSAPAALAAAPATAAASIPAIASAAGAPATATDSAGPAAQADAAPATVHVTAGQALHGAADTKAAAAPSTNVSQQSTDATMAAATAPTAGGQPQGDAGARGGGRSDGHRPAAAQSTPDTAVPDRTGAAAPIDATSPADAVTASSGTSAPAQAVQPTSAAPPATPPAAAPPPPAAQLAVRIAPLQQGPDGIHRLTVHLQPDDLGPVRVVAELHDGQLSLQLTGGTDHGCAALRDALPALRRDLEEAGLTTGSIDVGFGGAGAEPREQPDTQPNRPAAAAYPATESVRAASVGAPTEPTLHRAAGPYGLDVRI